MIKSDYHIHSEFSGDSKEKLENIIEKSMELGLEEIAITDHYEYGIDRLEPEWDLDLDKYTQRILELKDKYKGKIDIKLGLELGVQPHRRNYIDTVGKKYPFDFIIASSHCINDIDLYWGILQKNFDKLGMQEFYFKTVLENVKTYNNFSVYGHLDFVTRYAGEKFKGINYFDHSDLIDEILKTLIEKGKGIEINTSGIRYKEERFYPCEDILKRYKELGGEILTIGSDSHIKEHITMDFDKAEALLEKLGIKYITSFDKMKPTFKKL